jgi:hypothetical protein
MTDSEGWQPRQGHGRQYPQEPPWQAQQYDPAAHAQRIGADRQQEPWQQYPQQQPYGYQQPQYPPQHDPRGPQQWGQSPQQHRARSWPRRHKILSALIAVAAVLVVLVVLVVVAAAQPQGITPPAAASLPACTSHPAVTSRQWLQIAKNPDAAKGQCITVYGEITQFDSSTGTSAFRAQAGGARVAVSFGYADYPTNVVLAGTARQLAPFVEGDLFSAQVTVGGHIGYDTQIGGSTTAPLLRVDSVTRIGHLSS